MNMLSIRVVEIQATISFPKTNWDYLYALIRRTINGTLTTYDLKSAVVTVLYKEENKLIRN